MNDDVWFVLSRNEEGHRRARTIIAGDRCDALEAHRANYPDETILSISVRQ